MAINVSVWRRGSHGDEEGEEEEEKKKKRCLR